MQKKIVHIVNTDKFIPPFINFVKKHFDINNHKFVAISKENYQHGLTKEHPIVWFDKRTKLLHLLAELYKGDKIIIHGLWSKHLIILLFAQPWILRKCYWVMWGGDFYFPEKQHWIKKQVIKNIGHFITYIKGDYELAQKWYGAKGEYHECFMYPSNLYKPYKIEPKEHSTINIQLGNSAAPTNNHIDVLKKLSKYKDENIQIFTPLSYGDQNYAQEVIAKGKELFGEKFIPLTEFMEFEKYLEFLGSVDIAVFAHKRQQAMGNIITLLGLGKKVYMRSDISSWQLFKNIGVKTYDVENIDLDLIDEQTKRENKQKIKEYFSEENYLNQLKKIFGS